MTRLSKAHILGLIFCLGIFVAFAAQVSAVTVADQTQNWSTQLNVWQAIQELGTNLSGTAQSFTFRVSTTKSNLDQFDYTTENSRLYDKSTNTFIVGCISQGSNPADKLRGLTFSAASVPAGYQDVTIDFSCHNYNFIPGNRYLIYISNANSPNTGVGRMQFASATYSGTSNDYFTEGGLRYAFDNGFCSVSLYSWNSQTNNNGCNIFSAAKDDLYFVLTNTAPPPPPPKTPVIFIPGIGGSELKASQEIIWSKEDGHGGTYSHAYPTNEKIWVNDAEATKLGDDDYFDVLRLKADGITPEADLSLTGNLTSQGYGDIDSFFTGMGYTKGTNYFVFNYDWRKDVRSNKDSLDSAVEQAKTSSGQSKVNLVVHSLGGLIARYYISDSSKASKINKLIELGVPHLGSPFAIKALMYGTQIGPSYLFGLIAFNINEVKDVVQNFTSNSQLIPSNQYFSLNNLSPFRDGRDIDNNKITGDLNYDQIKNLLSNLNHNMTVFGFGEQFHNFLDPILNQANGVKIYKIVGSNQPTLGQIHETWWITWPINLIPKRDEIFINGDGTVPLYSASLKNDSIDLSAGAIIYYTNLEHVELVKSSEVAMQTVKAILNENSLPVEIKSQKFDLEGEQLSLDDGELELYDDEGKHTGIKDNGEIETNIPETFYSTSGKTKHAFLKKKSKKVKIQVTRKNKTSSDPKTTNLKIRTYKTDKISKTTLYKDLPISQTGKVEFTLDPALDTAPILALDTQSITATSEVSGDTALDQIPPTTKIATSGTNPVTVTLTASDSDSGILKIEYSLDNGATVQTYTNPFTISTPGKTTIQVKAIDKLGNEEIPQTITVEIATPTSSQTTSTATSNSSTSTSLSVNSTKQTISSPPEVLGIQFENPNHVSDEINVSGILDQQRNNNNSKQTGYSAKQILSGLLIASAEIVTVASLSLAITFFPKPTPK